jgi:hypothetical protein
VILSTKQSVTIADVYCDEVMGDIPADVVRYNHWSTPTPGARYAPLNTILIDLTQPVSDLLNACKKDTRYEIRRAEKDGVSARMVSAPNAEDLQSVCEAFNESVAVKGLPEMKSGALEPLVSAGALRIGIANAPDASPLAWHVYYRGGDRAILLYSISSHRGASDPAFRQLVGRANRYLHWQDLLRLRESGCTALDLGGWHPGDDTELLKINKFKEEFGGKVVEIYNSMMGISLKGKAALKLLALKRML